MCLRVYGVAASTSEETIWSIVCLLGLLINVIKLVTLFHCNSPCVPDVDTDELDSDTKNVEEEVVEFFVKEEVTVVE
jgi:hypothetical protein